MRAYEDFLQSKAVNDPATGLHHIPPLNPMLHEHQADMVRWARCSITMHHD